jgi:hypothetical protein
MGFCELRRFQCSRRIAADDFQHPFGGGRDDLVSPVSPSVVNRRNRREAPTIAQFTLTAGRSRRRFRDRR